MVNKRFDFGLDDNEEESLYSANKIDNDIEEDSRLDKLNQRVTLISILIPCILGVLCFMAYMDVKSKVDVFDVSRKEETKSFSNYIDKAIASISEKIEKMENSYSKQVSSLSNRIVLINAEFEKIKKDSKKLENTKVELKNEIITVVSEIDNKIDGTLKKIDEISKKTKNSSVELDGKISKISEDINLVNNKIKALKTEIRVLSADKIGKNDLKNAFVLEKKVYNTNLTKAVTKVNNKINVLENKLLALDGSVKKLNSLLAEIKKIKPKSEGKQSVSKPKKPVVTKPAINETPKSGKIIEQTIKE